MNLVGVAVIAMIGPVLLVVVNQWAQARTKKQDWERQDRVAEAAKKATDAMVQSQAAIVSVGALTVAKLTEVQEQAGVIHGLVNSAYTASLEATRVALVGQLEALTRAAGPTPTGHDADAITAIHNQITSLETTIANRLAAQRLAEAQAANTAAEVPSFIVPAVADIAVFPPPPPQGAA